MALLVVSGLLTAPAAHAETPEEKGLRIAQEWDQRDTGFDNFRVDVRMVLTDAGGQSAERHFTMQVLEQQNDGDKSLIVFDRPRDIDGTALLSFAHIERADDQWLYLPALRRTKRISSSNQSGPFVGSEFAYEDMTAQEVKKFTYRYLRDDTLNGAKCFVVERRPAYDNSGYTKQVVWFDKEHYRVQKTDFYDRKGTLLKTLTIAGYRQYLDRFWRPERMRMVNHQTDKTTLLQWSNYAFRTPLTESDFTASGLRRAR